MLSGGSMRDAGAGVAMQRVQFFEERIPCDAQCAIPPEGLWSPPAVHAMNDPTRSSVVHSATVAPRMTKLPCS